MLVEEGTRTYISNHKVELLNYKNQVKVIRTSTRCQVVPGADISEEEELELEDDDEHTCWKLEALKTEENFLLAQHAPVELTSTST